MTFQYSPLAESDLDDISAWSLKQFGADQTEAYLLGIEQACVEIARNPLRARLHQGRKPGVRRVEHRSHVIFYELTDDGILIGRILHKNMLAKKHGI
jgi:toxin ParE1/3/4